MTHPIIPWKFLDISAMSTSKQNPNLEEVSMQPKSFLEVVNNVCDIPLSQLSKPCLKGDSFVIVILEKKYQLGVEAYKNNLHGRFIWPKGSTPLTILNLNMKLQNLWKSIGK